MDQCIHVVPCHYALLLLVNPTHYRYKVKIVPGGAQCHCVAGFEFGEEVINFESQEVCGWWMMCSLDSKRLSLGRTLL